MTKIGWKFGAMLPLICICHLNAQPQSCGNSSLNGTYFYLLSGVIATTGQIAPYAELGELITNGQGGISGQSKVSLGGALQSFSLSGSYAVQANCTGTLSLSVNSQAPESLTFQIIEGGQAAVVAFSSSGGVLVGRAYRASGQCGNSSLSGGYGYLLSGTALVGSSSFEYSDAGQAVFDGNGGLAASSTANLGSGASPVSGAGTYSVTRECWGTAQVADQNGVTNYATAAVEGGNVLFLETDAGMTVSGSAQPLSTQLVLPQFAFGGGWYSALYFTNTNDSPVSFALSFVADSGAPLAVPSLGGASTIVSLAPHGTATIEAPNAGTLSQGYVSLALPVGVVGYGVFRQSISGRPDQEAVVPFSVATATSGTLAWDETEFTTSVAVVNPGSVAATVAISVTNAGGAAIGTSTVNLPPYGKIETALKSLPGLQGMAGNRGSAQFVALTGNVAALGLRFAGSAFTSIPSAQQ